jgi:hypothetical protein
MEATPAAPKAGDVNETELPAPQLGDPDRVTTRMDPDEKGIDGTNNMDMVTFDDPATTEDRVIVGESCRMIEPDGTLSDGSTSAEVVTDMPNGEFDCGEPIIMPEMVRMVASVPVAFPAVVRTKFDDDIKLLVEFRYETLELPVSNNGTLSRAKNPDGNNNVIRPPAGIEVEGVKLRVIDTVPLPSIATLSFCAICNETDDTEVGQSQSDITGT